MQYFMLSPHNRFYTRLYVWLLKLSFIYRISITLLVLSVLGISWFYFLYRPNELAIDQYRLDIVALQNRGVANTLLYKECIREQQKIEDLEKSLLPHVGVPAKKVGEGVDSTPSYLIDIVFYLNKVGMALSVGNRGNLLDKGWYTKQVVHINATGTMANIKDFFTLLYESKKLISCSAFEISFIDNDQFSLGVNLSLFRPIR